MGSWEKCSGVKHAADRCGPYEEVSRGLEVPLS